MKMKRSDSKILKKRLSGSVETKTLTDCSAMNTHAAVRCTQEKVTCLII